MSDLPESQPQKTLIIGEPLVQYKQIDGQEPEAIGLAGASYNFALTRAALQEKYGGGSEAKLYFGTSFSSDPNEKDDGSQRFKESLKDAGVNVETFNIPTKKHTGSYTIHHDKNDVPKDGQDRNSYNRDNAAARFYFSKENAQELLKKIGEEGITQIMASHILMGNSADRDSQLQFLQDAKKKGVEIVYADNYRASVWDDAKQAGKYSTEAMKIADVAYVSFDDEQLMHGDKDAQATAERIMEHNNIKQVYVTDGPKPAVVASRDEEGAVTYEKVRSASLKTPGRKFPAGAGDTFSAGAEFNRAHGGDIVGNTKFGARVATEVLDREKDNLKPSDLPDDFMEMLPSHPAVVSARYFYRPTDQPHEKGETLAEDGQHYLDPGEEKILDQIKKAKGVTAITTSLHTTPREQAFEAWDVVKMLRHVEYEVADGKDKMQTFLEHDASEKGAVDYLNWLKAEAGKTDGVVKSTGLTIMNLEDSRTSDAVKYGDEDQRDKDIAVEKENLRVLSELGLNSDKRPGFAYVTNFMTPFDWFRTDMDLELPDGSKAMAVRHELLAMFDRYVVNIEPKDSGYYDKHYDTKTMAAAKKMWKDVYKETDLTHENDRKKGDFTTETKAFIDIMLKGHAGSHDAHTFTLDQFRDQVKRARYMGQEAGKESFAKDPDGDIAHEALMQHAEYYAEELGGAAKEHNVIVAFHPDDTVRSDEKQKDGNYRAGADLGVSRGASRPEDIARIAHKGISSNRCIGCDSSDSTSKGEDQVVRDTIAKVLEKDPNADLTFLFPFLHARKGVMGEEDIATRFNPDPQIQAYLKKVQEQNSHAESFTELPHHVTLTPLLKVFQALDEKDLLWDIRSDHTTTLPFHMDYKSGEFADGTLGQPGYDISRLTSGQEIRIVLDAMNTLTPDSTTEFVTKFEEKMADFGLDSVEGYKGILTYLKDADFSKVMGDLVKDKGFKPEFKDKGLAALIEVEIKTPTSQLSQWHVGGELQRRGLNVKRDESNPRGV